MSDLSKIFDKIDSLLPELVPQKVNLNGTSKNSLVSDYRDVIDTLRTLDKAMANAMPHGRDYQTHSNPEALNNAQDAWRIRRHLINHLMNEMVHAAAMVNVQ